jgi:RNA polymerase-associated protein
VRLFLFNFEKELFAQSACSRAPWLKGTDKQLEKARSQIRDRLTQLAPIFLRTSTCWATTTDINVAIAALGDSTCGIDMKNAVPS